MVWSKAPSHPFRPFTGTSPDGTRTAHSVDLTPSDPGSPASGQPEPRRVQQPSRLEPISAELDLASLYDNLGARVYRLALRLCHTIQEAEDLCHDVFLRFWRQGRYEPTR